MNNDLISVASAKRKSQLNFNNSKAFDMAAVGSKVNYSPSLPIKINLKIDKPEALNANRVSILKKSKNETLEIRES